VVGFPYMNLKLSATSIGKFTHVKNSDGSKSFVTEVSDLGNFNIFQRFYDDACDVGFLVFNPATNVTISVVLSKELADYENNEVHGWEFTPSTDSVRLYPKLKNYKFVIYND
jgi:hypothetical protein